MTLKYMYQQNNVFKSKITRCFKSKESLRKSLEQKGYFNIQISEIDYDSLKNIVMYTMFVIDESVNKSCYSGRWIGYKQLCEETGHDIITLKNVMKELRKERKIELLYTSSNNGRCAGRGYFLTKLGYDYTYDNLLCFIE